MTTTLDPTDIPSTTTSTRSRARLSGVALALAGIAIVVGHALTIDPNLPAATYLDHLASHRTTGTLGGLLTSVGAFLILPGLTSVLRLVQGRRAWLGTLGATLWGIGAVALGAGDVMITLVMSALVRDHRDTATTLIGVANSGGILGVPFAFAPLFILGGLMCAVALFLTRSVPRWLAVLLGVGVVLVLASSGGGLVSAALPLLPLGGALVLLGSYAAHTGTTSSK